MPRNRSYAVGDLVLRLTWRVDFKDGGRRKLVPAGTEVLRIVKVRKKPDERGNTLVLSDGGPARVDRVVPVDRIELEE